MMTLSNDTYLIEYDNIKALSIADVLQKVDHTKGLALSQMRLHDLNYFKGEHIYPGHGVYLFRKGTDIVYVGKVRNMSFIERIPKHFDLRHRGWFNRLLKIICEKELNISHRDSDDNLKIANQYAFENLNLVLIHFKENKKVDGVERLLRSCINALNKFKTVRYRRLDQILDEYSK